MTITKLINNCQCTNKIERVSSSNIYYELVLHTHLNVFYSNDIIANEPAERTLEAAEAAAL